MDQYEEEDLLAQFAAAAMQGDIAHHGIETRPGQVMLRAGFYYTMGEAMLAEHKRRVAIKVTGRG